MGSIGRQSGWLWKSLPARRRPQADVLVNMVGWGVASLATAIWLVQPFDWLKEKVFQKPETKPEE